MGLILHEPPMEGLAGIDIQCPTDELNLKHNYALMQILMKSMMVKSYQNFNILLVLCALKLSVKWINNTEG